MGTDLNSVVKQEGSRKTKAKKQEGQLEAFHQQSYCRGALAGQVGAPERPAQQRGESC